MVEGRREQNRRERVEDLITAGGKLFLARGIEAVTIDQIAREAQMAKGNFYRYFKDKRALVDAILEPAASETRRAMRSCSVALQHAHDSGSTTAAYGALAMQLAQMATTHATAIRIYLQEHRGPQTPARKGLQEFAAELQQATFDISKEARKRGLLVVDDPRVSALAVNGAVESLALAIFEGQLDLKPAEVGQLLVTLVLEGIRKRS